MEPYVYLYSVRQNINFPNYCCIITKFLFAEPICYCTKEFTGRLCDIRLLLPNGNSSVGTIRIKNKGGFSAKATLIYSWNNRDFVDDNHSILLGQTYTFTYKKDATNVLIKVNAVSFNKIVFTELIRDLAVCYDLYGILPNPKYTRVNC